MERSDDTAIPRSAAPAAPQVDPDAAQAQDARQLEAAAVEETAQDLPSGVQGSTEKVWKASGPKAAALPRMQAFPAELAIQVSGFPRRASAALVIWMPVAQMPGWFWQFRESGHREVPNRELFVSLLISSRTKKRYKDGSIKV